MTRLIVVRHGNTFAPDVEPRRIGARTDLPLVASGVAQGRALGRHLARGDYDIAGLVAGPLVRTLQTAELILGELSAPPPLTIASWLAEIDYGPDEGMPESAVVQRVGPAALAAWETTGSPLPGWRVDGAARLGAWRNLFARTHARDTLLITSNGAARFALLALSDTVQGGSLKLRTGAFGVLERRTECANETSWSVVEWDSRPNEPDSP